MGEAEQAGIPEAWPKRAGERAGAAWTVLVAAILVSIPVIMAMAIKSAFLFVSIAPIIYECIERPLARASSPRSTIVGNGIALLVGYSALGVFGLLDHPSTVHEGVTVARAFAVIASIAVTGGLLVLVHAAHPPAGSTLLMVTLGILTTPGELACVFATIVIVTAAAWILNRVAGLDVPLWSSPKPTPYEEAALQ